MTVLTCDQRTVEWYAARCGRLTSSCVDLIFKEGRKKGEESTQRRDLRIRLALEQLSGRSLDTDNYRTAEMERGVEREPDARLAYEAHTGVMVREVGFVMHDEWPVGTSPDGVVGEFEGVIDFKCPKSATHIEYLRTTGIPKDYLPQLRHHLWVTGAQWADFVSFDDRLPDHLQLVIRRLWAKDAELPGHALAVQLFLSEVERERLALQAMEAA